MNRSFRHANLLAFLLAESIWISYTKSNNAIKYVLFFFLLILIQWSKVPARKEKRNSSYFCKCNQILRRVLNKISSTVKNEYHISETIAVWLWHLIVQRNLVYSLRGKNTKNHITLWVVVNLTHFHYDLILLASRCPLDPFTLNPKFEILKKA